MVKNEFLVVKKMFLSNIIFLVLNFSALYLGVILANEGGSSDWYSNLTKAPWEPDGWVFGAAWTSIMICFSVYMSINWNRTINKKKIIDFLLIAVRFECFLESYFLWFSLYFIWIYNYSDANIFNWVSIFLL